MIYDNNQNPQVVIPLDRYEDLIIARDELDNLIRLAFNKTERGWAGTLRLNMDDVEAYIKAIRPVATKAALQKIEEQEEAHLKEIEEREKSTYWHTINAEEVTR